MANEETRIQNEIQLAIGCEPGVIVWRNNVGLATYCSNWRACLEPQHCPRCGSPLPVRGTLRRVRYGLAPGSADLICCVDGHFVAGEVKTPRGRLSRDQRLWQAAVRDVGGVADVWRSPSDALESIEKLRAQ